MATDSYTTPRDVTCLTRIAPLVALALALSGATVTAATTGGSPETTGVAVHQRFRPDGSSVVTTVGAGPVCVAGRRSPGDAGDPVEWPVPGNPAASVQAVQGREGGPGFRVRLAYSPRRGVPILLRLGGQEIDLRDHLEPSTDSLWIDGAAALALAGAFRDGPPPELRAVPRGTGQPVSVRLGAPDMEALGACVRDLAGAAPGDRPETRLWLTFHADAESTPLASLPGQACGMPVPPGPLHLARLETVTGFFAQTDSIYVSFADDGSLSQAYVPGILEADFRPGHRRSSLSRAADGNVPSGRNTVTGCPGVAPANLCRYDLAGNGHLLTACPPQDLAFWGQPDTQGAGAGAPGSELSRMVAALAIGRGVVGTRAPGLVSGGQRSGAAAAAGGALPGGGTTTEGGDPSDPGWEDPLALETTPPPSALDSGALSPVPLPAPAGLVLSGLLALGLLRFRRTAGRSSPH